MELREPDDVTIRLVAEGLVERAGTDHAATELVRLCGRDRATEALCRTATVGTEMTLQDDVQVILDLTGHGPVLDLRDPGSTTDLPAAPQPPSPTDGGRTGHRAGAAPDAPELGALLREGFDPVLRGHRVPAVAGRPHWL